MSAPEEARGTHLVASEGGRSLPTPLPAELEVRTPPVAQAILWTPTTDGPMRREAAGGPLFVTQGALARVLEHVAGSVPGAAVGLLAGRRYRSAEGGEEYVLVDGALALPPLSATAALGTLLGEGLLAVPDRDGGILGWYRSHVFGDAALTPGDADAHLKYFRDDFQLCLVIAGSGAGGGWFRPAAGVAWQFDCLPFHEVLSDVSLRATGARPSVVGWRNYRTSDAVVRKRMSTAVDAATVAKGSQAVLLPVEDDGDDAPPAASPARRAASARGAWRQAAYVVAAAVGALGTYAVLAMRAPERDAGGVAGSAALAPLQRLDLQADTLEIALAAFDLRARMFEARQMRCDDLARGLVQLEEQWLAYNVARRGRPAGMDEGRAEQARAAHERVEEAERRFERSRCARP